MEKNVCTKDLNRGFIAEIQIGLFRLLKNKTEKEEKLERRGFIANNVGFDPLLVSMKKKKR